ncbi:MAG: peptidoglycan-associated lipoprotein Pal [bacterium]
MSSKRILWVLVIAALVGTIMMGCAAKQQVPPGPTPEEMQMRRQQALADSLAKVRADSLSKAKANSLAKVKTDSLAQVAELERQRLEQQRLEMQRQQAEVRQAKESLSTIYYDFDKSELKPAARAKLQKNAELIRKYDQWQVTVEGHCDERGSTEYNLALGERRANSVKEYYVNYGINASRLEIISYGEERPVDKGHDEAAWAKNRRAVTVVK